MNDKRVIVLLNEKDNTWLYDIAIKLKKSGWGSSSQSAIMRAMLKAIKERNVDMKDVSNEDELVNRLVSNL